MKFGLTAFALRTGATTLLLFACVGCGLTSRGSQSSRRAVTPSQSNGAPTNQSVTPKLSSGSPFLDRLVEAAIERTTREVRYDPAYVVLAYPNGDVPEETGVCTDEVIRSYRAVGVDLQREVHEDMARDFAAYPRQWGQKKPDANIDHRRVPNLRIFFERQGAALPITADAKDYKPGDAVTWDLGGGQTHIGLVVNVPSTSDENRLLIVHNIGAGPQMEDVLFNWKITGHYRYFGPGKTVGGKQ